MNETAAMNNQLECLNDICSSVQRMPLTSFTKRKEDWLPMEIHPEFDEGTSEIQLLLIACEVLR